MTTEWRIVFAKQVTMVTYNVSYSSDKKRAPPFLSRFLPTFCWTLYHMFSDYSKFIRIKQRIFDFKEISGCWRRPQWLKCRPTCSINSRHGENICNIINNIQLLDRSGYREKIVGCVYNISNEKGKGYTSRGTRCANVKNWNLIFSCTIPLYIMITAITNNMHCQTTALCIFMTRHTVDYMFWYSYSIIGSLNAETYLP